MVGLVGEVDDGEPAVREADPGHAGLRRRSPRRRARGGRARPRCASAPRAAARCRRRSRSRRCRTSGPAARFVPEVLERLLGAQPSRAAGGPASGTGAGTQSTSGIALRAVASARARCDWDVTRAMRRQPRSVTRGAAKARFSRVVVDAVSRTMAPAGTPAAIACRRISSALSPPTPRPVEQEGLDCSRAVEIAGMLHAKVVDVAGKDERGLGVDGGGRVVPRRPAGDGDGEHRHSDETGRAVYFCPCRHRRSVDLRTVRSFGRFC